MILARVFLLPVRLLLWLPRLLVHRVFDGDLLVPTTSGEAAQARSKQGRPGQQSVGRRHATRGSRSARGPALVAALIVAVLVGAVGAMAYWTAPGSGSGAAKAGHLNPPTGVTVPANNSTGTVPVGWTGSASGGGGVTPVGYYVERNDGGASWSLACGSDSTTNLITTGTSCEDTGLSSGSYTYRVWAISQLDRFLSDPSGSVTVSISVDDTPPDVHVTEVNGSPVTFPYSTNGTITSIGGTCGTAAGDLAPVDWSIGAQSGTATCSGGGTWSSGTLTTISAEGGYTASVSQDDSSANDGSDSVMISIDTTAPVVMLTSVNGGPATFPKLLTANVTAIGGACGVLSGDSATIHISVTGTATLSDTATCNSGTWTYTFASALSAEGDYAVTATQADTADNTGTSGAKTITVDKTAPITAIVTSPASPNGSNGWYTGTAPTFMLNATDTAGSGIATTKYQIDGGTITLYTGSAVTIPDGQHTISYWSTDNAGNVEVTNTTATIKVDTVNPAGGAITANSSTGGSFNATGTVSLSKTNFSDSGSGIASNVVTRATATLSGNTCIGAFTGATVVTISGGNDSASLATACYQYTLTGVDNAGNNATVTSAIVKVDRSAPTGGAVTANGSASGSVNTTGTLSLSKIDFSDADSGMGSNVITRATAMLSGNVCGGFSGATVVATPTDSGLTTACYQYTLTGTNNAGGTAIATSAIVKVDTSAPTGGSVTANGSGSASFSTSGTVSLSKVDFADPNSGMTSNVITRATATLVGNVCGSFSDATIVATPSDSGLTTACYQYTLTGTNNAGSTTTATSAIVKVDTSTPVFTIATSGANITTNGTNTVTFASTGSNTFTVTASDPDSGISGVPSFPAAPSGWIKAAPTGTSDTYTRSSASTGTSLSGFSTTNGAGSTTSFTLTITFDGTGPTNSLSLASSPSAVGAFMSSANGTLFYKANAPGSFTLVNTVTDAGSGPFSATFPAIATAGWSHNAQTVSTPTGGQFSSTSDSWSANPSPPSSAPRTFTSSDVVGNSSGGTVLLFTVDNTNATAAITSPVTTAYNGTTWAGSITGTATDPSSGSGVAAVELSVKDTTTGMCADPTGAFTVSSCSTNFVAATGTTNWTFTEAASNLTAGDSYTVTVETIDNVGNTNTSAATATWSFDTTAPTVTSLVLSNGGNTAGKIEEKDTFTIGFSEGLSVSSICSNWSGDSSAQSITAGNAVTVTLTDNNPSFSGHDTLTVTVVTGSCGTFNLGTIDLGSSAYVSGGNKTFSAAGNGSHTASTVTYNAAAHTLAVLIGEATGGSGTVATVTSSVATYVPSAALTDIAGNGPLGNFSTAGVQQS